MFPSYLNSMSSSVLIQLMQHVGVASYLIANLQYTQKVYMAIQNLRENTLYTSLRSKPIMLGKSYKDQSMESFVCPQMTFQYRLLE